MSTNRFYSKEQLKLYHGSRFLTAVLKPGFEYTGRVIKWDHTEDNTWLYASTSKEEAQLNALASSLEANYGATHISFDSTQVSVGSTRRIREEEVRRIRVCVYTLLLTPDWIKVNNEHNGSDTEYKTRSHVQPISREIISPLDNRALRFFNPQQVV